MYIKNSGEILNKLNCKSFLASSMPTYDFTTVYTTLPHNLIKGKLTELFERTINREVSLYLPSNEKNVFFFTSGQHPKRYNLWSRVTPFIIFLDRIFTYLLDV